MGITPSVQLSSAHRYSCNIERGITQGNQGKEKASCRPPVERGLVSQLHLYTVQYLADHMLLLPTEALLWSLVYPMAGGEVGLLNHTWNLLAWTSKS